MAKRKLINWWMVASVGGCNVIVIVGNYSLGSFLFAVAWAIIVCVYEIKAERAALLSQHEADQSPD